MGRATVFKGVVELDGTRVPVRLYTAARRERVSFRLLHAKDRVRLVQRMYCSKEDEPVAPEERARGYEVARGQYVVLDPDEIKAAQPKTGRGIEVLHFVDPGEIDPRLYDRPYYLGPDGEDNAYALLARALGRSGRAAICRWTMRRRRYLGVLRARDKLLLLVTLRYAHELIDVDTLDLPHPKVGDEELATARDLIGQLSEDFDLSRWRNEHQQRILDLIERKARGEKPKARKPRRRRPTRPSELQERLEQSLAQARSS